MRFAKLQGTGNDFIVLNNIELGLPTVSFPSLARRICTRRVSLGADALMVAEPPRAGGDFRMGFYNADGTEAEMCGNGARCLARFAYEEGLAGEAMTIETAAGPVYAWREDRRRYRVRLNDPKHLDLHRPVEVHGETWDCTYLEVGVPHAVVRLDDLADWEEEKLRELGRALRHDPAFPQGANVNFYAVTGENRAAERTFERGVEDFTLACGTGSGAVAAAMLLRGEASGPVVRLRAPGGELWVEVRRRDGAVTGLFLSGETNWVARGELTDEDFEEGYR